LYLQRTQNHVGLLILVSQKSALSVHSLLCQYCHFDCISANHVHEPLLGTWYQDGGIQSLLEQRNRFASDQNASI